MVTPPRPFPPDHITVTTDRAPPPLLGGPTLASLSKAKPVDLWGRLPRTRLTGVWAFSSAWDWCPQYRNLQKPGHMAPDLGFWKRSCCKGRRWPGQSAPSLHSASWSFPEFSGAGACPKAGKSIALCIGKWFRLKGNWQRVGGPCAPVGQTGLRHRSRAVQVQYLCASV